MTDEALTPAEKVIAAKIVTGKCTTFTDEEIAVLRKVIKTVLAMETLGRMAELIKKIITWFGWAIAAYLAFKAGAIDWMKGTLK